MCIRDRLNSKISELSAQVQSLQQENATLKSASEQAAGAGDQAAQAAQVAAAKLTEAEESNRALSAQNEQLKDQVDLSLIHILKISLRRFRKPCCTAVKRKSQLPTVPLRPSMLR